MASDERDSRDRRLLRETLDQLFHKSLDNLGGQSYEDILFELVAEEWQRLTERSADRNHRALPTHDDARNAFDAIKHSTTADARKREQELPDPAELSHLTLSEINTFVLSRMQVKHWMAVGLAVSAIFGAGAGFAEFVRAIAN